MDKATGPGLFVNDGSFMERFKQLQEEKEKKGEVSKKSRPSSSLFTSSTPKTVISNTTIDFKASGSQKTSQAPSSGKLAFSLKQKSKLVATPVKFGEDDEEEEVDAGNVSDGGPIKKPKLVELNASDQSSKQVDVDECSLYYVVHSNIGGDVH
ncbi:hypothetical protein OROMI_017846 [Orobanche minor]